MIGGKLNTSENWNCSCDIEIAFPGVAFNAFSSFLIGRYDFNSNFSIEDKNHLDWGSVLVSPQLWEGDRREISKFIREFIIPMGHIIKDIKREFNCAAIVRLGIYSETVSFTFTLDDLTIRCLMENSTTLEVSIYP